MAWPKPCNAAWAGAFFLAWGGMSDVHAAPSFGERLEKTRARLLQLQRNLIDGIQQEQSIGSRKKLMQSWLQLQREEKALSEKRLAEIQRAVQVLEDRKRELLGKVQRESLQLRRSLERLERGGRPDLSWSEQRWQREAVRGLAQLSIRDLHAMRADLDDAEELEGRLGQEQAQLLFVTQDLAEQESLLKFQQELQAEKLKHNLKKRAEQLEQYRQLKLSEFRIEGMMQQFRARSEFEQLRDAEREVSRTLGSGPLAQLKGRLPWPLAGTRVLKTYGKTFDESSQLTVFKKGVELGATPRQVVTAVADGRVAFVGELPRLGQVVVVDHGAQLYSLVGQLGETVMRQGDVVKRGAPLARADASGRPIYFEIRARNVAVDPLQWVDSSFMVK